MIYKDEQPIAVGRMYFKDKTTMILGRIAAIERISWAKIRVSCHCFREQS
ncbi:MAG: hypothetical protein ACLRQF_12245 [Thomasclavelia ramosa]